LFNPENVSIMKYPQEQYQKLLLALREMSKHFDLRNMPPSVIYSEVCGNLNKHNKHNWLYFRKYKEGTWFKRAHIISEEEARMFKRVIPLDFELNTPEGCNDSHGETAVKRAVKEIYSK